MRKTFRYSKLKIVYAITFSVTNATGGAWNFKLNNFTGYRGYLSEIFYSYFSDTAVTDIYILK